MDPTVRVFDGPALLQEQADLLASSTPADINYLYFLKVRRSAQQKATVQRNRSQRQATQHHDDDETSAARFRRSDGWDSAPTSIPLAAGTPLQSSRFAAADEATAQASTSLNPEDLPASVAKRRSMGDVSPSADMSPPGRDAGGQCGGPRGGGYSGGTAASSLDDRPAVASRAGEDPLSGVPEHPREEVRLEPCPHCGRTFAPGRLDKHIDMCRRQMERELALHHRNPVNRTAAAGGASGGLSPAPISVDSSVRTSRKNSVGHTATAQPRRRGVAK